MIYGRIAKAIRVRMNVAGLIGVGLLVLPSYSQQLLGPLSYRCFNDSPFAQIDFSQGFFYLENYEDRNPATPGVSYNGGIISTTRFPRTATDSVDCDDGVVDGRSCDGESFWNQGNPGFIIDFNRQALGAWPTHVGVVWTDGEGTVTFRAYDENLRLIGQWSGAIAGLHNQCTDTAEDRFFGIIYGDGVSTGIRRIQITNLVGGIEIDHLQYGFPGPLCRTHNGDVDNDGCVDDADLLAVLFAFGRSGQNLGRVDVNCDQVVDDADLLIVLFNFGRGC